MITGVAIQNKETKEVFWSMKPARHHNVIALMVDQGIKTPIANHTWTQGFITGTGASHHFLNREDAALYAYRIGQIKEKKDILFSECLW